jgi:hypothetical protein
MNNENCNYTYRGYNIVIRNDNGVVRIGKTIFTTINNHPTNDLRSILETFVDALYLHEPHDENDERFPHQNPKNRELIEKLGANIFKGLQLSDKLAEQFTLRIAQLFEHFQNKWQQAVYIRFGTTGHIKDGIAGRPNFQIETKDGLQKSTHRYDFTPYDEESFKKENITEGLTLEQVNAILPVTIKKIA